MTRRETARLIASAAALPLLTDSVARNSGQSVIVIGAGMSGLSAASLLQRSGCTVTVLEARDRVGGRVWTSQKWKDAPVDLGASWIHGEKGNPLTRLADDLNVKRVATDSNHFPLYDNSGGKLGLKTWAALSSLENSVNKAIRKVKRGGGEDVSLLQAIDQHMKLADMDPAKRQLLNFAVNSELELSWATDIKFLSAKHVMGGEEFGGKDVIFPGGYHSLDKETITKMAMTTLQTMYGKSIPEPVDVQITRWASDPFALCSYSSPGVGITNRSRSDLAAPLKDRLFFAGEATHSDHPSTVHGAMMSGQREAERILAL